jgi:hypothetical protein
MRSQTISLVPQEDSTLLRLLRWYDIGLSAQRLIAVRDQGGR